MTILGGTLVAIGAFVLVLVDGPRMFRRVGRLTMRRRKDARPAARDDTSGRTAGQPPQTDEDAPGRHEAAYRGLAPGWYRDPEDPSMARYWDGSTLGEERRRVKSQSQDADSSPEAAYRGLAVGWYRDPEDPSMARYWDGSTLGEERRRVAEPETPREG